MWGAAVGAEPPKFNAYLTMLEVDRACEVDCEVDCDDGCVEVVEAVDVMDVVDVVEGGG